MILMTTLGARIALSISKSLAPIISLSRQPLLPLQRAFCSGRILLSTAYGMRTWWAVPVTSLYKVFKHVMGWNLSGLPSHPSFGRKTVLPPTNHPWKGVLSWRFWAISFQTISIVWAKFFSQNAAMPSGPGDRHAAIFLAALLHAASQFAGSSSSWHSPPSVLSPSSIAASGGLLGHSPRDFLPVLLSFTFLQVPAALPVCISLPPF